MVYRKSGKDSLFRKRDELRQIEILAEAERVEKARTEAKNAEAAPEHSDPVTPANTNIYQQDIKLKHEPERVLSTGLTAKAITEQGVIACIDGTRGSVFFTDEKLRDLVFRSLLVSSPNNLASWGGGNIKEPRNRQTAQGELYEIKLARPYVEELLTHPGLQENRVINRGFEIKREDKVKEAFAQFARIVAAPNAQTTVESTDTYVPGRFDHIQPLTRAKAIPARAVVSTTHSSAVEASENDKSPAKTAALPSEPVRAAPRGSLAADDTKTHTAESVLPPSASKGISDGAQAYNDYIVSFGFRLKEHRENRQLSRDQVAEQVSRKAESTVDKVTAENVKRWEQARGDLPNANQFEALSAILIDDNRNIADKAKAREEFNQAYQKGLAAKKSSPANEDDVYALADKITELREARTVNNTPLTREKFASMIEDKLRNTLPKNEIDLLTLHKGKFIAGIEAGVVKPSKDLMLALVKVMDDRTPLDPAQKQELYDAYERIPDKNIGPIKKNVQDSRPVATGTNGAPQAESFVQRVRALPVNGADKNHAPHSSRKHPGRRLSNEEPGDPVLKLKFKLRQIVNKDDLSMKELSRRTSVNYVTLGSIFSGNTDPFKVGGFSKNTHQRCVDYMRTTYGDGAEGKIAEFEGLYAALKEACDQNRNGALARA